MSKPETHRIRNYLSGDDDSKMTFRERMDHDPRWAHWTQGLYKDRKNGVVVTEYFGDFPFSKMGRTKAFANVDDAVAWMDKRSTKTSKRCGYMLEQPSGLHWVVIWFKKHLRIGART